jgi:hypothetical protein
VGGLRLRGSQSALFETLDGFLIKISSRYHDFNLFIWLGLAVAEAAYLFSKGARDSRNRNTARVCRPARHGSGATRANECWNWLRTAIAQNNDRTAHKDTASELIPGASAAGNCRDTRGNFVEVLSPQNNVTTGTILNAGWLNPATEAQFDTPAFTTPDPHKSSFGRSKTIATGNGVFKGRRVYVFDVVSGFGMDMTDIDSKGHHGSVRGSNRCRVRAHTNPSPSTSGPITRRSPLTFVIRPAAKLRTGKS